MSINPDTITAITISINMAGAIVHVDLMCPFEPDMSGCKYMMVFIDEAI